MSHNDRINGILARNGPDENSDVDPMSKTYPTIVFGKNNSLTKCKSFKIVEFAVCKILKRLLQKYLDESFQFEFPRCGRGNLSSVTRLGHFWKVLATNFLTKIQPKYHSTFGQFWKTSLFKFNVLILEKKLGNFISQLLVTLRYGVNLVPHKWWPWPYHWSLKSSLNIIG